MGRYLVLVIIWTYQAAAEYRRWEYEPVSYLWKVADPGSDSSDYWGKDKVMKYQGNPEDQ